MIIRPKRNQVLGRPAEVRKSEGGLLLPDSQHKNTTVFVIVEAVGPEVRDCKEGDIVIPRHVNHIFLRGGFHRVTFEEEQILATVDETIRAQLTMSGEEAQA